MHVSTSRKIGIAIECNWSGYDDIFKMFKCWLVLAASVLHIPVLLLFELQNQTNGEDATLKKDHITESFQKA